MFDDWNGILIDIESGKLQFPFVQKARKGGYDGRGVSIIRNKGDLHKILEVPSLVEDLVDIHKEIGVIVARNPSGQIKAFDAVEMVFDPEANLVDYLFAPAEISDESREQVKRIATQLIADLDIVGLLAVEFFETFEGKILINEVAPRPHNSGHHSIEACITSQFQQHLRAILDLPLGSTLQAHPFAMMINILGAPGHKGIPIYDGIETVLEIENVFVHIYGKTETRPARKMGHITILGNEKEQALLAKDVINKALKVIAK